MGRFSSPDRSNLGVDFELPQSWNRYAYALNNPLSLSDRNGRWPYYIHEDIIYNAFPNMSQQQSQTLIDASWNMDNDPGAQSAENSYKHGMRDGLHKQTVAAAEKLATNFIRDEERDAQQIQAQWIASGHTGISPQALAHFGNALHTITDELSPAHAGFQPWYGQGKETPSAIRHFNHERTITPGEMAANVKAARDAFQTTFGFSWDEFDLGKLMERVGTACVSATDNHGNTVTPNCAGYVNEEN
jgi:hypothetical protein